MMLSIKVLVAKIICSSFVGELIGWIYGNKIPFHGLYVYTSDKQVKGRIKAMLFWGMYESAEVRFVQKYLTDKYPVIELGGSIGVVTAQIASKVMKNNIITFEANPELVNVLEYNLTRNNIDNVTVVNAAYGCEGPTSWFEFGEENILGKIVDSKENVKKGFWVKTINLENIITTYHLKEYVLVCDIEGAEIGFLLNECQALKKCRLLIIETHTTSYRGSVYKSSQMKQKILDMGFELVEEYGVNLVFRRS